MNRMACVIALAAGTAVVTGFGSADLAHAAPLPAAHSGLQIAVSSTSALTKASDGSVSLEVTFKGGNLRSVELHLDGYLIKKQSVKTREGRGVITFDLDGLTDGTHAVLVKATATDGSTATTTTTLTVSATEAKPVFEENVLESGTHFTGLRPNQMVQGVVPVQIEVEKAIHSPYVTYLIDNEFLAFMNYAPFTYNLDTAHMTNGVHTINVEIYDGDSLNKVRTLSMKINVNNPGGFTKIKRDSLPLKAPKAEPDNALLTAAEAALPTLGLPTETSSLSRTRATQSGDFETRTSAPAISLKRDNVELAMPRIVTHNTAILAEPDEFSLDNELALLVKTAQPAPRSTVKTASPIAHPDDNLLPTNPAETASLGNLAPGSLAALANPGELDSAFRPTASNSIARLPLHLKRNGNIATLPSFSLKGLPATTSVALAKPAAPKLRARMSLRSMSSLKGGFAVSFDAKDINFDVLPRVTNGVPLAPLRQIFETSGGEVAFYNKTKTVRAVSNGTEIQIRVGHRQAKVNDKTVKMEAVPFIENGRTIVPLSFIRDAMNVDVSYDPTTGHLLIESKK